MDGRKRGGAPPETGGGRRGRHLSCRRSTGLPAALPPVIARSRPGSLVLVLLAGMLASCGGRALSDKDFPATLRAIPGAEPVWLVLGDGRVLPAARRSPPGEPYLPAVLLPDGMLRFGEDLRPRRQKPVEPPFNYTPGWIEIETRTFRRDMEGIPPRPPFLRGWYDERGRFTPGPS